LEFFGKTFEPETLKVDQRL